MQMKLTDKEFSNLVNKVIEEHKDTLKALADYDTKTIEQQRFELQIYITQKGMKGRLEAIVSEFNKDYAEQKTGVFYSWLQSKLKRDFGKKYDYEFFSYCTDRLNQLGFRFMMD